MVAPVDTSPRPVATTHPLDPLTGPEISAAATVLREERGLAASVRFVSVSLLEPDKSALAVGDDDQPRLAAAVLYDRATRQTIEAVVDLDARSVTSRQVREGVQPSVMLEEFFQAEDITRADPRWQEAVRKRGVTDFSLAMVDPWATGYNIETDAGRRLLRPLTFLRSEADDNGYGRPVEGLLVVVDLDKGEVVDVQDHGVVPLPPPGQLCPGADDPRGQLAGVFAAARRRETAGDHPAGRPEFHGDRARGRLAEVAPAGRVQPA